MKMLQLMEKLPPERFGLFMESPIWRDAAEKGLLWQDAMVDPVAVKEAARRMSSYAQQSLRAMLRQFGAEPAAEDRLLQALRERTSMAGAECRIGLRQLESAGILFAVRKMWGELLYFIPVDSFLPWQQALFPCRLEEKNGIVNPITDASGAFVGVMEPFGRRKLYALAALLKTDASFTAKGVLPKKTIQKLDAALRFQESKLRAFPINWAHSEHYSAAVALFLSASGAAGFLRKEEGRLLPDEAPLQDWLALPDEQRERGLLQWLLLYLLRASGREAHIAGALLSAGKEKWYSIQDAESLCAPLVGSNGSLQADQTLTINRRLMRWIDLFHELGWMELAELQEGRERWMVFRWRSFPAEMRTDGLIVQPNGEIITPPDCGHAVRWELETIAERQTDQEPVMYRITSASIAAALEQGRSRDRIVRFLKQAGGGEALPSPVEAMLMEWTRKACRFAFDQVSLLRCDSVEMAEHALQLPELAPLLLQRLGDKDFIVDSRAISDIRSMLQKSGYPPRKAIGTSAEGAAPPYPEISVPQPVRDLKDTDSDAVASRFFSLKDDGGSWLYEPSSLHHFELVAEEQAARPVELLPGIESVPSAWWRQLRSYHASTRKELMQQAVMLETAVQLRVNGELLSFVPEQVEQRGNEWAVTGRLIAGEMPERSRLTPDMWEEMKLLLPEGITT
ncbi:hypothetical protein D3P08_22005 [Paenibacillus nanensis]|uniref:Helicase XPB/Ssl2 N-terminal domain-containing protein n=1 Tax=Paenibacillus nanensis TaxID=393251 RepID=A0A3A1UQ93_9BACL|nr:helicase-associated domain-containing protein [Paenibacillus nanensis]RIX49946.1 hypothetical protein D3P08_22005 [Paenibacillus nanensis]